MRRVGAGRRRLPFRLRGDHGLWADAEKLGGYFPNLNAIAAELLADKAPAFLLREFANFLSRSKWIVSRQQDPTCVPSY